MNFWKSLKKPILGLAPMDGVTDAAMRFITKKYGKPDVIYTEFVSAEGLIRNRERLGIDLRFDELERPVVAQLFGKDPVAFEEAAKIVVELGFDGVDINMGCPAKKVAERGAGGGLMKNIELAKKIIEAVKSGVSGKIPVSLKTRIGWNGSDEEWWKFLGTQELAAIAIHGRTLKQGYAGKANWEEMERMVGMIREGNKEVIILGNGDIESRKDLEEKMVKYSGFDGGLIGREAWGNPWVFLDKEVSQSEKFEVMVEQAEAYEKFLPEKPFYNMRKHLAWYAKGFADASVFRSELVTTNNSVEVKEAVAKWEKTSN